MDFTTFFDIYMRPRSGKPLDRDGIEFRYAAASLLIACSKSDMDEDPEERKVIRQILANIRVLDPPERIQRFVKIDTVDQVILVRFARR